MYNTRKIGLGLAMVFGLILTVPVMSATAAVVEAGNPCDAALAHIREAQGTITQMQKLGAEIHGRQAQLQANVTTSSDEGAPLKCPACGMMMPMKATAKMTKAVKYGGKTYYCCKGCDMSATADKE